MDNIKKSRNGGRKPPVDMPQEVKTAKRAYLKPAKRDNLPRQTALTDEPEQKLPAKWKGIVKKILIILALLLALAFLYLFLLMGEPDDDDEVLLAQSVQEEVIQLPMTGQEMAGTVDMTDAAMSFGKPVMQLRGEVLPLLKAALYDTAYHGGYARRLTFTYQFPDGSVMTVDSIRPAGAITLLRDSGYTIRAGSLYSMGGMDAVRMDSANYIRVAAKSKDAVYVVHMPLSKAEQLVTLLRYTGLLRTDGQS